MCLINLNDKPHTLIKLSAIIWQLKWIQIGQLSSTEVSNQELVLSKNIFSKPILNSNSLAVKARFKQTNK